MKQSPPIARHGEATANSRYHLVLSTDMLVNFYKLNKFVYTRLHSSEQYRSSFYFPPFLDTLPAFWSFSEFRSQNTPSA